MPTVRPNEEREPFVNRCIPVVLQDGTAKDDKQAVAICNSMWSEAQKMKLETEHLDDIEIAKTGNYKDFNMTEDVMDEFVKNFNNQIYPAIVTINHSKKETNDMASFLRSANLGIVNRLKRAGQKLLASFKGVPKKLVDLIRAGTLQFRSIEFLTKYRHANGGTFNNVLTGVTFHGGANGSSAISSLADIVLENEDVEQLENLVSIEFQNPIKEDSNMADDKINIDKDELEKYMKTEAKVERLEIELKASNDKNETLKSDNEKLRKEISTWEEKQSEFDEREKEFKKKQENSLKSEAETYIDGIIKAVKLKPAHKDYKVKEYMRIKADGDEEEMKLFKDDLESRGEVVDTESVTKDGKKKSLKSLVREYNGEDDVKENAHNDEEAMNKEIQMTADREGISYEDAAVKLGYFDPKEVGNKEVKS